MSIFEVIKISWSYEYDDINDRLEVEYVKLISSTSCDNAFFLHVYDGCGMGRYIAREIGLI